MNSRLRILLSIRKNTIYESTLPFYYLLRTVGYGCFTIKDTYELTPFDLTEIRPLDIVIFIYYQFYNFFCLALSLFQNPASEMGESSMVSVLVMKIILWISMVNSTIGTIIVLIKKSSLFSSLKRMYLIDVELKRVGLAIDLTYYFKVSLMLASTQTAAILFNLFIQCRRLEFSYLVIIYGFMPNGNYATLMSTYMIFTKNIQIRLAAIRKYTFSKVGNDFDVQISKVGSMYAKIYESSQEVYQFLSFQIMLCVLHCYVYVVYAAFATYMAFINGTVHEDSYSIVLYCCWSSFYILSLILVVVLTNSVHNECYRFKVDVSMAINKSSNGAHKNKV